MLIKSFIIFIMTLNLIAEKPEPLNLYGFTFPKYEIQEFDGIKYYLIQDSEQPITNVRILFGGGSAIEKKAGVAELTSFLLNKGTNSKNAFELSEILDGTGSRLSISASEDMITINVSFLNKHSKLVLETLSDILNNPTFPEEEIKTAKVQMVSGIISEKSNPGALANKLSKKVIYGPSHPYSNFPTEEGIEKITQADLIDYYKKIYHKSNVSIAVYGDYNDDILNHTKLLLSKINTDPKMAPDLFLMSADAMPYGIYFIKRESSVQSNIRVLTKAPDYGHKDYEDVTLTSAVIGSSFTGRLFKTLREKHSYTYSPSSNVTNRKVDNYFYANADVNESVTDSSINVIFEQIKDLSENEISKEELDAVKKYRAGSFMMNFENSSYLAGLIQNSEFKGKRAKTLESYVSRLMNTPEFRVKTVSKEYFNLDRCWIVVVGPESVKKQLIKYGKIREFDKNINPYSGYEKVEIGEKELLKKYTNAIQGESDLKNIISIYSEGTAEINANGMTFPGTIYSYKDGTNFYEKFESPSGIQEKFYNGTKFWISAAGLTQEMPVDNLVLNEFRLFGEARLYDNGFKCKVLGKKDNLIYLMAISPEGKEVIFMFDSETYLLRGQSLIEDTPNGREEIEYVYKNYQKVDFISFPKEIEVITSSFKITTKLNYKLNSTVEGIKFEPNK